MQTIPSLYMQQLMYGTHPQLTITSVSHGSVVVCVHTKKTYCAFVCELEVVYDI